MVNPLHAATPVLPQDPSPYFPSSRRFRNLLYLRVEDIPGVGGPLVEAAARAGTALNEKRLIDRDAALHLKLGVLEELWSRFEGAAGFEDYIRAQGQALEEWALFCVLAESHGGDWREWPRPYRRPAHPDGLAAAA